MKGSTGPQGACRNPPKFCPDEFSITTGRIVLFGDMMDKDMKFCKRVSKGTPVWGWPMPKLLHFI